MNENGREQESLNRQRCGEESKIDFFQVFAKNSLIKNIFEEEKKFDSGTRFFFRKIAPNWVYFGQGEDFKLTTELSEKMLYYHNQAIKNSLNEAILLMSINEALLSR